MELQLKYVERPDGTRNLTLPDEIRASVISFVQDNARKSCAEMKAVVQTGQDDLQRALAGVSEEQARYKPAPDRWSILELLDHVVSTRRIIVGMCQSLAQGHLPPGVGAEWEEESRQDGVTIVHFTSLKEARDAVEAAHGDLLKVIDGLDGADTSVTFKHFLFGPFNSREWTIFSRIHDWDHAPTIEQIKATPGFPG